MESTKRLLASFLVIASILVMAGFASANVSYNSVTVNGLEALQSGSYSPVYNVSVLSGNSVPVAVTFTANSNESNVRLSLDLQGFTNDITSEVLVGDVEAGKTYTKTLTLQVPTSMADVQSNSINLVLSMWNGDFTQPQVVIPLNEQRQTYNAQVMSLNPANSVKAGDLLPVSVVLKNTGYNQLNDLYVTVSLPAIGVSRTAYFGDLNNAVGNNDTKSGTVYIPVPYNATAGTYVVQAEVKNSNFDATSTATVSVTNQFQNNAIVDSSQGTANVGSDATYSLTIVNPTSSIGLYKIVPVNATGVSVSADSLVTVPAGSSKTVTVKANANSAGTHNFGLQVFSGSQLTGQVSLSLEANSGISSPVAILTIVLAVVFVVLLVVLIVLVTRKPKKQEEFGESYY